MTDLTQEEIAAHLGLSSRALRDKLKSLSLNHKVNTLTEIRLAYINQLRELAAGRSDDSKLGVARTRNELASASMKELDLQERLKIVIWSEDLAPALDAFMGAVQAEVMNAGGKIIHSLEAGHDIELDDELISVPLRAALNNAKGNCAELIAGVLGEPVEAGTESTDTFI